MYSTKMIVFILCAVSIVVATSNNHDQTQIERYSNSGKVKTFQLEVPGSEPITIIETASIPGRQPEWIDISVGVNRDNDNVEMKDFMTDVIHDVHSQKSRCYGPSCQEGNKDNIGPQGNLEEYLSAQSDPQKDYRDFSQDRLDAINALAAKLKKQKLKADRLTALDDTDYDEENNGKVYTTWNKLKVKQHKHPYDDKDGWISLEPVAWSSSKISKWKPNIKKYKPTQWNDYDSSDDDRFNAPSGSGNTFKRPSMTKPTYINNKLHVSSSDWDSETPSRPPWNKPSYSYPSSWKPDDGRRPQKPNCDSDENYPSDDTVFNGMTDSVMSDSRPTYFPYDYDALKRPVRRPTQVVYAGQPDLENERDQRPPHGDGQWVLLSTTKGYRNRKRQRSLPVDDVDSSTIKSHQSVGLTVLPVDNNYTNMTTSHGGILEVERSFKTVEESKRDMEKNNISLDPTTSAISMSNTPSNNRVLRRKVFSNAGPDSSAVLAAVSAGMVPATMAMVVPMMLGRRKRDVKSDTKEANFRNLLHKFE